MDLSSIPYKFQHVWATGSGAGPLVDPIPDSGATAGHASQQTGYALVNATPVGSGGVPPYAGDMNGVLKYATSWLQWLQAGGTVPYDGTFQGWIGGYPSGAIVQSGTLASKFWQSTTDNNATDPDTGGGGWLSFSAGKFLKSTTYTAAGAHTHTFDTRTGFVIYEVVGGGGGSGGAPISGTGNASCGFPGNGGAYGVGGYAPSGATQALTVGAAGTAGVGAGGTNGGASSVTGLITAPGGAGGPVSLVSSGSASGGNGTTTGLATGANIKTAEGGVGGQCIAFVTGQVGFGGGGGAAGDGGGGPPGSAPNINGHAATSPGAGGGGTAGVENSGAVTGANGAAGRIVVWEFSA